MIIEKIITLQVGGGGCSPSKHCTTFSFIFNSLLILQFFFLLFRHLRQVISCTVSTNQVNYSGRSRRLFLGGLKNPPKVLRLPPPPPPPHPPPRAFLPPPPPRLIWRTESTTELYKVVVIFFPTTWPKDVPSILLPKKSPTNCISIVIIRRKKCLLSLHKLPVK